MVIEAVRDALVRSPLMATQGYQVTPLLGPQARATLAAEAARCHETGAAETRLNASPDEDVVRGNPARHLESAPGGPALAALYTAPTLHRWLHRVTGVTWTPSGGQATYSYYRRAGHFLGVHRDIDVCDLAVIVCVHDQGAPSTGRAGSLSLWPERTSDRITAIREDPDPGRVTVRLEPGEGIVLLGGVVPHALEPLAVDHLRIVAPLCFRA